MIFSALSLSYVDTCAPMKPLHSFSRLTIFISIESTCIPLYLDKLNYKQTKLRLWLGQPSQVNALSRIAAKPSLHPGAGWSPLAAHATALIATAHTGRPQTETVQF